MKKLTKKDVKKIRKQLGMGSQEVARMQEAFIGAAEATWVIFFGLDGSGWLALDSEGASVEGEVRLGPTGRAIPAGVKKGDFPEKDLRTGGDGLTILTGQSLVEFIMSKIKKGG